MILGSVIQGIKCHDEEFRNYSGASVNLPKISSDREIT